MIVIILAAWPISGLPPDVPWKNFFFPSCLARTYEYDVCEMVMVYSQERKQRRSLWQNGETGICVQGGIWVRRNKKVRYALLGVVTRGEGDAEDKGGFLKEGKIDWGASR